MPRESLLTHPLRQNKNCEISESTAQGRSKKIFVELLKCRLDLLPDSFLVEEHVEASMNLVKKCCTLRKGFKAGARLNLKDLFVSYRNGTTVPSTENLK